MNVFVTGGTGTVGDLLVAELLERKHTVTVMTRDKSKVRNKWKDQVNLIEGDLLDSDTWYQSVADHDAIINLVGENVFNKRWTKEQKGRLRDSRVKPLTNLVTLVKSMDKPPKAFISVSGTDYYPNSVSEVFTETHETPAESFLGKLTKDWEAPLSQLEGTQTRTVIFRMGVAFGYSGKSAERMFLTHKLLIGGWIGSGNQIYSWIHIKDFVGLLIWSLENNEVRGVYNGVAPDYRTMKELATIGGKVMKRWTWTWAPSFMLKLVLGERAAILLDGRAVSSEKVIAEGYDFKFPHAENAIEDILTNKE